MSQTFLPRAPEVVFVNGACARQTASPTASHYVLVCSCVNLSFLKRNVVDFSLLRAFISQNFDLWTEAGGHDCGAVSVQLEALGPFCPSRTMASVDSEELWMCVPTWCYRIRMPSMDMEPGHPQAVADMCSNTGFG
ncbi:hypothetical protein B296_00026472 [Ensete ventricosum]|uniref:Uncharacterized protein n=1 Tax=Ensete ventricosum TaxID=4639 RepID=A0A426ZPI8_ENSVE|nr:hypothetical protein B296_00026472 [Ensete ventricosum]